MISVAEVVADADMMAPLPFIVHRSMATWVLGGIQSTTFTIDMVGPVQRATDKDLQEMPEADRVHNVMAFWTTQPLYVTSGSKPSAKKARGITPTGTPGGSVFNIPANEQGGLLFINGLLLVAGLEYTLVNGVITFPEPLDPTDTLFYSYDVGGHDGAALSDVLQYEREMYRVLAVRHYPGSGYYKALGTRLAAA